MSLPLSLSLLLMILLLVLLVFLVSLVLPLMPFSLLLLLLLLLYIRGLHLEAKALHVLHGDVVHARRREGMNALAMQESVKNQNI